MDFFTTAEAMSIKKNKLLRYFHLYMRFIYLKKTYSLAIKIYEGRYGRDVYEEHLNVSGALFRFYLKTLQFTTKCCFKNK